jgi:hypothetical protein
MKSSLLTIQRVSRIKSSKLLALVGRAAPISRRKFCQDLHPLFPSSLRTPGATSGSPSARMPSRSPGAKWNSRKETLAPPPRSPPAPTSSPSSAEPAAPNKRSRFNTSVTGRMGATKGAPAMPGKETAAAQQFSRCGGACYAAAKSHQTKAQSGDSGLPVSSFQCSVFRGNWE